MTELHVDAPPRVVALVGNPNTGKTTLFNALTGASQNVGNYPGVTIERRQGSCKLASGDVAILDLPGAYSLTPASADEQIVVDVLAGRIPGEAPPAAVVCVVETGNLRRNLFLASQISELGLPMVVVLNMFDEAELIGARIDVPRLSQRLGVPVVPTVASKRRGMGELRAALDESLRRPATLPPVPWPDAVREALASLGSTPAEASRRLFDADSDGETVMRAREVLRAGGFDPVSVEAVLRYKHVDSLLEGVSTPRDAQLARRPYAIDGFLTHRLWGLVTFAALMFSVFASVYWIAQPAMDGIEWLFGSLSGWTKSALAGTPMFRSLVAEGVIAGVGGVFVFLPQILILYLFVAVLEDSGYMARAAFLMDKVFSWTGLNGKSFVPMLSSFACAVPAIMTTRTIEDPRARLTTILVAPLMSCSARLPVYVLMIGAFIQPKYGALWAAVALFAMHALGLVVAIPIAFIINKFLLRTKPVPFLLEMPPYRRPTLKSVLLRMYRSGVEFVVRAGTVIFAFSIVIWALTYFPRPDSVRVAMEEKHAAKAAELKKEIDAAYLEQSYMGRFGKLVQPVFAPAGFDWKITVGVLAAFPAREVIVSTLGIIYSVEGDNDEAVVALKSKMAVATWPDGRPVYTPAVAIAIMVFFAFCLQCGSTVAVMAKEAGWKWAAFAFVYMTGLAWAGAVVAYQVGKLWA